MKIHTLSLAVAVKNPLDCQIAVYRNTHKTWPLSSGSSDNVSQVIFASFPLNFSNLGDI